MLPPESSYANALQLWLVVAVALTSLFKARVIGSLQIVLNDPSGAFDCADLEVLIQHLVAVLGRPDDMVAVVKFRVTAGRMPDSQYPTEESEGFLPQWDPKVSKGASP